MGNRQLFPFKWRILAASLVPLSPKHDLSLSRGSQIAISIKKKHISTPLTQCFKIGISLANTKFKWQSWCGQLCQVLTYVNTVLIFIFAKVFCVTLKTKLQHYSKIFYRWTQFFSTHNFFRLYPSLLPTLERLSNSLENRRHWMFHSAKLTKVILGNFFDIYVNRRLQQHY